MYTQFALVSRTARGMSQKIKEQAAEEAALSKEALEAEVID